MPTKTAPRYTAATLTRYRIAAYVTGVGLLALLAAMIVEYDWFGTGVVAEGLVATIGPIHGFLYAVYFVTTLDLAWKRRWRIVPAALVLLAGTIPFVSFVAERVVTHRVRTDAPGW